jgi:hypothetical protein
MNTRSILLFSPAPACDVLNAVFDIEALNSTRLHRHPCYSFIRSTTSEYSIQRKDIALSHKLSYMYIFDPSCVMIRLHTMPQSGSSHATYPPFSPPDKRRPNLRHTCKCPSSLDWCGTGSLLRGRWSITWGGEDSPYPEMLTVTRHKSMCESDKSHGNSTQQRPW